MQLIDFSKTDGLVPAIIQDATSGVVLMLGYMNDEALHKSLATGVVWFWSRSKQRLWMKGEVSGNHLAVHDVRVDCDRDTLLITAELIGTGVCHTGKPTCFYTKFTKEDL